MSYYTSAHKHHLRSRVSPEYESSPASSSPGAVTPPGGPSSPSSSTFLTSSVSSLWGGLLRRFSTEQPSPPTTAAKPPSLPHARTFQPDGDGDVYSYNTPPHTRRTASPMRPPPLEPLQLLGFADDTRPDARLLTRDIAEEIRIMVPPRLSIVDEWNLVYSLEQDGASLATLYEKCARYQGKRVGFVLCVKDCEGGIFGAYLSDYPHPAPKYFGTGECFLWRASVLSPLPPLPLPSSSANNNNDNAPSNANGRSSSAAARKPSPQPPPRPQPPSSSQIPPETKPHIRFKAFPYSGVNDYYMLCEAHFLSLGAGGDGRFGLWLDSGLEKGVSATSQTFGNEPLSDEGDKFDVLGVEVWVIGA